MKWFGVSNRCGSNYNEAHLRALVALATKHRIPVISDEIYAHMVFTGETFTPLAALAGDLPVFTVAGIAKQYLVPGWRMGWILTHDPKGYAKQVHSGFVSLSQEISGPNTLVQAALPKILHETPKEYYTGLNAQLEMQVRVDIHHPMVSRSMCARGVCISACIHTSSLRTCVVACFCYYVICHNLIVAGQMLCG